MLRSQSANRLTYQNITSRIQKIKANAHSNSLSKSRTSSRLTCPIETFPSRPVSAYKGVLKSQPNGMFGIEIPTKEIGKVQKNIGIKKYNQMQIKEILYRNSPRLEIDENYCKVNDLNLGNEIRDHMLSPRFSCPQVKEPRQSFIPSVPHVPKTSHIYQKEVSKIENNKKEVPLSTSQYPSFGECEYEPNPISFAGNFLAGKIYSFEELTRFSN